MSKQYSRDARYTAEAIKEWNVELLVSCQLAAVRRKTRRSSDRLSFNTCHSTPQENRHIQKMWKYDQVASSTGPSLSGHCLLDVPQPKKIICLQL